MEQSEICIDSIKIVDRHRKHMGDIEALAASIEEIGLLHPVVVTPDFILIAGQRRIEAYKYLERGNIPVHFVDLDDVLRGECDENKLREDYAPSEWVDIGRILEDRIYDKGASCHINNTKTRDIIASHIGVGGRTYEKAKAIVEAAEEEPDEYNDLVAEMDKTGKVDHAYREYRKRIREPKPKPMPAIKSPILIVARAEHMLQIESKSIDLIITSPPYNLGQENWPMGGDGRAPRTNGIGYTDGMPEQEYQNWQLDCLIEMYRVAKDGASLFYNHKIRNRGGQIIHPMGWLGNERNPWVIRQEIIWDRRSTHNHSATLFWPHDERIYWMTKGNPALPKDGLHYYEEKDTEHDKRRSTIWRFHGPNADTWHPAPFDEELPRRCIEAIGHDGITVLDPFAGSCTTLKVALEYGYIAIGVDISREYLEQAAKENGWTSPNAS